MPKVSVVIPSYNRAAYLRSAIASVLNQSFQDFEIIVVDDASKDDTNEVIRSFNDLRINYVRHELNKGVSAARNTGIKNSSSDYIAFLDDDDEWLPEKLWKQINLLENSSPKIGGVYTGYVVIDRSSGEILDQRVHTKKGNIFDELIEANLIGATPSLLFRKECFNRVGLFDENMSFSEDWDMWIRISKEFHFECIQQILVKCYFHNRDKLTFNLESLEKGMEIMLKKYGQFTPLRRTLSYSYLRLGVLCCYNKQTKKGRVAFVNAIRLYPFEIRHYFNFGLSLLGVNNFRRLKDVKEKIIASLRHHKISIDRGRV